MTISSEIIEVLEYLCTKFGIVIDWTSENVMPYIQSLCEKFIKWEISTSTMWAIIGVIIMILGFVGAITDIKKMWADGFMSFFGFIIAAAGFIVIATQAYDIITCICFPELKLYNYISQYI